MKKNLFQLCMTACVLSSSLWGSDASWDEFKKQKLSYLPSIQGWCTQEKAEKMMDLILSTNPKVCVEVGVFGGSSIYPTALALAYQQEGVVYAIDPWSNEACLKGYRPDDPNYLWWSMIDLERVFRGFIQMLQRHHLTDFCKVMRMSSQEAVDSFSDESIDILHIDGTHTESESYNDTHLYFPKVKVGGYIWLDDIQWVTIDGNRSLQKALLFLLEKCEMLGTVENGNCMLLRKIQN